MATKKPIIVIHEIRNEGDHRLVAVEAEGTNTTGEWVRSTQLATLGPWFGNNDPSNGLPPGVFTVREYAHQVLT